MFEVFLAPASHALIIMDAAQAIMSVLPPVRFFGLRFLYNIVQVALCSYMAIEAGLLAYRNVCNSPYPVSC